MKLHARQVDAQTPAGVLLLPIHCPHCGHPGLRQVNAGTDGAARRTWSGRCPDCRAEVVFVVEAVVIRRGTREYAETMVGTLS